MIPTTFLLEKQLMAQNFIYLLNSVCIISHFGKEQPIFMTVITSPITVSQCQSDRDASDPTGSHIRASNSRVSSFGFFNFMLRLRKSLKTQN